MTIEIVYFPIKNGASFHSYVSLPEGKFAAKAHLGMGRAAMCQITHQSEVYRLGWGVQT